jgi:hypothetical protein
VVAERPENPDTGRSGPPVPTLVAPANGHLVRALVADLIERRTHLAEIRAPGDRSPRAVRAGPDAIGVAGPTAFAHNGRYLTGSLEE